MRTECEHGWLTRSCPYCEANRDHTNLMEVKALLEEVKEGLGFWITLHALEFCEEDRVKYVKEFLGDGGGVLYYVATLNEKVGIMLEKIDD